MPRKTALRAKAASKSAKASPPRRLRLPPEERRAQIIEAARALFAEGGLEGVTMRSIARRVGITQAAIYQHFEDKDAILFAIAEGFFGHLIEAKARTLQEDLEPVEMLRRAMRNYVENGLNHPEEYRLVFMTDAPGLRRHAPATLTKKALTPDQMTDPEIQPSKGQIAYGHLQELVRALLAEGHIRGDDPETVAEAIWAAGHGVVTLLITHVEFLWTPEKLIDTQIDMLLNGLLPDDSPARKGGGAKTRR
jgi:AcrR family transcriptional regulator